jgi:hypothetical protein
MPRPCATCHHIKRSEIDKRLAAGEPVKAVAREFGLNFSSLNRHRVQCVMLPTSNKINREASQGTVALANLPSRDELGFAYEHLRIRCDAIATKAEAAGSLSVALAGLKEVRSTLDSIVRLAGHAAPSPATVAVQINNNFDADAMFRRLLSKLDDAPEARARVAQALFADDGKVIDGDIIGSGG